MAYGYESKDVRELDYLHGGALANIIEVVSTCDLMEDSDPGKIEYHLTESLAFMLSADGTHYICTGLGNWGTLKVTIPSFHDDGVHGELPVREIADSAFAGLGLEEITISKNVKKIGRMAFNWNSRVTKITIENEPEITVYFRNNYFLQSHDIICHYTRESSVKPAESEWSVVMEKVDFDGTYDIYKAIIPYDVTGIVFGGTITNDSVTEYYTTPNNAAYVRNNACYTISKPDPDDPESMATNTPWNAYTPKTVDRFTLTIGDYAFSRCGENVNGGGVSEITIPNTVKVIPAHCFDGIDNGADGKFVVNFAPNSQVTTIGDRAFPPNGVTEINWLNVPIEHIGAEAFSHHSMETVTIPKTVKTIGAQAFFYSTQCKKVLFAYGNELESIGDGAFGWCKNLTEITIPASVKEIGVDAFENCGSLTRLAFVNPYGWLCSETGPWENGMSPGTDLSSSASTVTYFTDTYRAYYWYRITKLPTPELSIDDHILSITDPSGLAQAFDVYVNGYMAATLYPKPSGSGA